MHNKMFCYNCHEYCHTAANCKRHFDSFGIICYYVDSNDKIKYLAIKRKYSLAYCEFIRGRYNILDFDYLNLLFSKMTMFEHHLIQNSEFKPLWNKLWICTNKKSINKFFLKASIKFYILKSGFKSITNQKLYKIDKLLETCKHFYKCSEWYFPKGKKEIHEESIESAIREFEEETNIQRTNISIETPIIFQESHKSYNNKNYRTFFHIAKLTTDVKKIDMTKRNKYQRNEIGNIEWLTLKECLNKFRNYETSKKTLILKVHQYIIKKQHNKE